MRISDWSSDVCSSDLLLPQHLAAVAVGARAVHAQQRGGSGNLWQAAQQGERLLSQLLRRCGRQAAACRRRTGLRGLRSGRRWPLRTVRRLDAGAAAPHAAHAEDHRSEEHTSELQSLMRISYAVFCLKKKQQNMNE